MEQKILIANRGEIALRVIRACQEMGIPSVQVYSEPDRNTLPVMLADQGICIGDGPAEASYLKVDRIIAAAEVTGATAIHPGYGFLSENAHFAEICQSCGLTFIGPSAAAIRALGDKNTARRMMKEAGVPIVPGSDGIIADLSEAKHWADEVGYPVMLKASAGGGGKGMRLVRREEDLENAFHAAQREARQAFGNGNLFLEKYIENPKHVEIQLMADSFGNVVQLGDRDCSMQRRHQKMIEESPCLMLDDATRQAMGEAAIRAAKSANYTGAGTVEFLLGADGHFYFMEMNTRIQVEHPVTEAVTGRDLVREQINVALGNPLSFRQDEIHWHGHAIEIRVNAEDCAHAFAPTPGKILFYSPPGGPGVRVDSHLTVNCPVPPYYDSLLGKIIVYGNTREQALQRAHRALGEFWVEGVSTNCRFADYLLQLPSFLNGSYHTTTIEQEMEALGPEGLHNFA